MPYETVEATVINAKIKKSKNKGTLSINFYLQTELDGKPVKVYADLWIADKCLEGTRKVLKDIDFDFDARDLGEINKGALNGKTLQVYFKEEEYEGKKKPKCNICTPFSEAVPVQDDDILEAQARLRGQPVQKKAVNNDPDDLSIDSEVVPF